MAVAVEQPTPLHDLPDLRARTRTAVLLDPHPLWLDALERVLGRIGVEVVAKVDAPGAALAELERQRPDLLVAELAAGDGIDGVAWLERLLARARETKAIVLSRHEDPELIDAALRAGAVAFVIKTAHPDDLVSTVRQAFEHSVYLGSAGVPPSRAVSGALGALTPRELEILRMLVEGHSNAQVARLLWVTEQTVKFHLSNIYRKLGVTSRTEAARIAARA